MGKKNSKKPKLKKKEIPENPPAREFPDFPDPKSGEKPDFGGLPEMDLKKNLGGCG